MGSTYKKSMCSHRVEAESNGIRMSVAHRATTFANSPSSASSAIGRSSVSARNTEQRRMAERRELCGQCYWRNRAFAISCGFPNESTCTDGEQLLELNKKKKMAKNLFRKGVEHERSRRFHEAILFYKRAVQLVPDIEVRLYESTNTRDRFDANDFVPLKNDFSTSTSKNSENHETDEEETNLFLKLSKIVSRNRRVCFPKFEQKATHISALPMEIVLYILRWVVSSELDFRSLEMFSRVCRGFYISARDTEIWRLACVRVWGVNCGTCDSKYKSWRDMYLLRPRLKYNGCYINKTSYVRNGENNFQDRYYRPWHLVEYFRYLRFFPDGRALMLTSTEKTQSCVNFLRNRVPHNPSVLVGHFRLHDNYVTLALKRQETKGINFFRRKKREPPNDTGEQTFHIELEIQNHFKRVNSQLKWISYSIHTKYKSGQEARICLKDPSAEEYRTTSICGRYPPLKFSRIKSYTQESKVPL